MTINLDIYEVNTLIYLIEQRIKFIQSKIIDGEDNELEEQAIKRLESKNAIMALLRSDR